MTYSHAKVQGQRSIGSEDEVEINDRQTNRRDGRRRLHYSLANAVGNYQSKDENCLPLCIQCAGRLISHFLIVIVLIR